MFSYLLCNYWDLLFFRKTHCVFQSIRRWLPRLFSISSIKKKKKKCKHFLNGSLIIQSKWSSHRASGDFIIHVLQANVLLISWPYRSINKSIHAISVDLHIYLSALWSRSIKISRQQCQNLCMCRLIFMFFHLNSYGGDVHFYKNMSLSWKIGR